jgi:4-hydroxy-3-polyprenylbenzoate decarboxylase
MGTCQGGIFIMAYRDLREFIAKLEETGDVVKIKEEVDWDLEAAAISRRVYEMSGPALLFTKIKDYPRGYRLFGGSLGTFRRVAIALGLDPSTPVRELYQAYETRKDHRIPPKIVKWGPCKENILTGQNVDINRFPTPYIHEGDGGRYIGTWDLVVSKDPETGWHNWGMYRFMIHNERYIVGFPRYHSHLGRVLHQHYVPRKQLMPIALVLGADPISHLVASASIPKGVSEAEVAGGVNQQPIELVTCETSDLLVPAHAEIVIEAEILPDATAQEGPFGEYPGYRTEGVRMGVLARVNAVTFRNDPILTMISLGIPPDDNSVATPITSAVAVKERLKSSGIPVTDVYTPPEAVIHTAIVGVKTGGRAVVERILDALTVRRADWSKIIVVDADVDVFDMRQVIHAFSTKCHPTRGIIVREVEPGKGNPLTPCLTPEERRAYTGPVVAFDCTWPPEWSQETHIPIKASFDVIYPEEIKQKVLRKWEDYGL